jgi:hypothetical protein
MPFNSWTQDYKTPTDFLHAGKLNIQSIPIHLPTSYTINIYIIKIYMLSWWLINIKQANILSSTATLSKGNQEDWRTVK